MVYTPDGMKPLSMIKFNPLVAVYRTITTNSLIARCNLRAAFRRALKFSFPDQPKK